METPVSRTPDKSPLDRATDPEYAAVSSAAVIGLVSAVAGVWPLLLVSKQWVEPPTSARDLAVMMAIFVAAPVVSLVLSLVALVQIRRSWGVVTGRRIALAGLATGGLLTAAWAGWLTYEWRVNEQTLRDLEKTAYGILDDLLAGRYEPVYERIPEDFRRRQPAGYRHFHDQMAELFEGAGPVLDRRLLSLRIVNLENGATIAPAEMHVDLERRILQVGLTLGRTPRGTWELLGIQGAPTFESMMKYDNPYDRLLEQQERQVPAAPPVPAPTPP